jgi:peptidoglycan/LPS O-acetylase OafA/YrhL
VKADHEPTGAPAGGLYARLSVPGAAATGHARWADVDALRAIAALMVLAAHAFVLGGAALPPASNATYTAANSLADGVWLFFSVSGFLIAGPFLAALVSGEPLPPWRRYATRRAARILPAYWIAFAAMLVLVTSGEVLHWWQLPVHLTLVQALVPYESQSLYFVAWTLSYEAIFYVLVPAVAIAVRRVRSSPIDINVVARVTLAVWALTVAYGFVLALFHPFGSDKLMSRLFSVLYVPLALGNFCPGMLVFLAQRPEAIQRDGWWARYRNLTRAAPLALGLALTAWVASEKLHWRLDPYAYAAFYPLVGIASGLVVGSALNNGWPRPVTRVLAPIGLVSYGIYLWHWVIRETLVKHQKFPVAGFSPLASVAHAAILLALTLPVALLSWVAIERPLLRRTTLWDRS